ncbi:MAG: DUF1156 domain-containing protein [Acetobacteraceae bacterium]|nr:DUF1156 domain-containing protein [Acetobacteraceae bacterium]
MSRSRRPPRPAASAPRIGRRAPRPGWRAGRALIEEWLPAAALGYEAQRERAASSALPPLYFLHVWWARRPLVVSRAAVVASLLPAWSRKWPPSLRRAFPSRDSYQGWVARVLGVGEPVGRPARPDPAPPDARLRRPRAFAHSPTPRDAALLRALFQVAWRTARPLLLDPMAGGGSIPFEALRCGLEPLVNELNPVAWVVLQATLAYPARFGPGLAGDIRDWGRLWAERVRLRLERFYPAPQGRSAFAYLWARTVPCPTTGRPVPLSPNWWLRRGSRPAAARLRCEPGWARCRFEVVCGEAACAATHPGRGTVRRGVGVSPWTGEAIPEDWIKSQAQAGRLGQQLYAVASKTPTGLEFRPPGPEDERAAAEAEAELARRLPGWRAWGLVPSEPYPDVSTDARPRLYGMPSWAEMFSPRQLLAQCTMLEVLLELAVEMGASRPGPAARRGAESGRRGAGPGGGTAKAAAEDAGGTSAEGRRAAASGSPPPLEADRARAVLTYLALALDKACDYNSRFTRWDPTRAKITNTFARHDFSLKWSHAEFDAARSLLPWALDQVLDAYAGIARLLGEVSPPDPGQRERRSRAGGAAGSAAPAAAPLAITLGDAARLPHLPSGSVHLVCLDPPYFDNVQYAECSDFFYVWLKRALGSLYPPAFSAPLTEKRLEAVANPARSAAAAGGSPGGRTGPAAGAGEAGEDRGDGTASGGKRRRGGNGAGASARQLAAEAYRSRMAACLLEARRVLRSDGLLTVMFTHKRAEAWAALASALAEAGFEVRAAWPVRTESQHSLHQAGKAAAASTALLACRPRGVGLRRECPQLPADALLARVRRAAWREARRALRAGARGPDLHVAVLGRALAVLTRWRAQGGEGTPRTGEARREAANAPPAPGPGPAVVKALQTAMRAARRLETASGGPCPGHPGQGPRVEGRPGQGRLPGRLTRSPRPQRWRGPGARGGEG